MQGMVSGMYYAKTAEIAAELGSAFCVKRRSRQATVSVGMCWSSLLYVLVIVLTLFLDAANGLREFRSWSRRHSCEMARDANYPFSYEKYAAQPEEAKGRVNSNLQDFRHDCEVRGGASKCGICEDILCESTKNNTCFLQLQGVDGSQMSKNVPTVSDTAWAVRGAHRRDYGGPDVSHFCTFLSNQGGCTSPGHQLFDQCETRCFGSMAWLSTDPTFKVSAAKLGHSHNRSVIDLHAGHERWMDDGQVDIWDYPKDCTQLLEQQGVACTYGGVSGKSPSFNPQGFTFTHSGSGEAGFADGAATAAKFQSPDDIVVDANGYIWVSDTKNNAIREVALDGSVRTIAGKGPTEVGFRDGPCADALFTEPRGLDVRIATDSGGVETTVIVVADTGNHRIRQIDFVRSTGACTVSCLSGLCGKNTLSATAYTQLATPYSGYADGNGLEARFSAPEGVAFMDGDSIAVADTGNFLIRWVYPNGTTFTLAGDVQHGQMDAAGNPIAGCQPPCLRGQEGFRDGPLTYAQFLNPLDVTRGPFNSLWVADEHRIRIIELPHVETTIYTIKSEGRVSTIAGTALQGHEDGLGDVATFFNPSGITVTSDTRAYVVDSASCRVRRISYMDLVARKLTCDDTAVSQVRPSGCTSYNQPHDEMGRKVSRVEANIQYNFGWPNDKDVADGRPEEDVTQGKFIKNCVGTPPQDELDKKFVLPPIGAQGQNLVIDDDRIEVNEDSEQGMSLLVHCPGGCIIDQDPLNLGAPVNSPGMVYGNTWYGEKSSVCKAAIHQGQLDEVNGGYIRVTFQRRDYLARGDVTKQGYLLAANLNNIQSSGIPQDSNRVFTTSPHVINQVITHTAAGAPAGDLESGCGYSDNMPPTLAYFNRPRGISAKPGTSITDDNFLFVADTLNHRIRGISATCTQICENGGRCVAPDTCSCQAGWMGIDCTTVDKSTCTCGPNQVCVAPGECACKPGYTGFPGCNVAQCVQECYNGGTCSHPDTCQCNSGWFDSNCTTPVCSNTCANGGNCTSPNTCSCPDQWSGSDCRIPVCTQTCENGGSCVAPDTCSCGPQWTNYDCSVPVCLQGKFVPNPGNPFMPHLYETDLVKWPTYRQCNREQWCNYTNEFECAQMQMSYDPIEVPSGPAVRAVTGRKDRPNQCMQLELPINYVLPFELSNADGSSTGTRRFSPISPYQSDVNNHWRGYEQPVGGHTGPWTYTADRQIANVEWLNISQGVYVCANNGNCTHPGVCECADGWAGFDCRTPVCSQGYWHYDQGRFVSGMETPTELDRFKVFMRTAPSNMLDWPYSNPNYTMVWETYADVSTIKRVIKNHGHDRYQANGNWTTLQREPTYQGGYKCSVRSVTPWENRDYIMSNPGYYSRYMDYKVQVDGIAYTHWQGMHWLPTHQKSRVLDMTFQDVTYGFTSNGWRRMGAWNTTENVWQYGVCITEFERNCTSKEKQLDLQTLMHDQVVQDTDLAYRPRVQYTDVTVHGSFSYWKETGGECVDQVLRGCFNNGTCVAPDTCRCSEGWSGHDCSLPVCQELCLHGGNCTQPNTCTCERGWEGPTCTIPLCAQDCLNDGKCIAPDTCQCAQWENSFRDGRLGGGKPMYQDDNGDPLRTGWTGFDCSTPVCVQATTFYVNVPLGKRDPGFKSLGGHGGDNLLDCFDPSTGKLQPRCPQYDIYVTGNEGATYQGGCGFDPYDTGCCVIPDANQPNNIECYRCKPEDTVTYPATFFCRGSYSTVNGLITEKDKFSDWLDEFGNFKMCGAYHNPRYHNPQVEPQDYGIVKYYTDFLSRPLYTNRNYKNNMTSHRFLCNVRYWEQGDYRSAGDFADIQGAGSIYGLTDGRHIRINYANMTQLSADSWATGAKTPGEGVFACENSGSCLAPDICSCTDGYEGYDCNTPLCRHLQPDGTVSSCSNGGICESKDTCDCIRVQSKLSAIYPESPSGETGWTGSDCTIPMCIQGFYDPFCTDLPEAPAGQGCYRCANAGNCTAPDVCTCAEGWSGFDCRTPLCEVVADPLTRTQLGAIFEYKVISFETDPCGLEAIYGRRGWKGQKYARGNCTEPNICTCLCKFPYSAKACKKLGTSCDGPWQDPMVQLRNVVGARGAEYSFGSTDCYYGYEGNVNDMDQFTTCHHTIYRPSSIEQNSVELIAGFAAGGFLIGAIYYFVSARLRQKFILAKIERRRSKRSSEESLLGNDGNRKSSVNRKSSA